MRFSSCQEVTRLMTVADQRPLSLWERCGMAVHRFICAPCRYYRKQIEAMQNVGSRLGDSQTETSTRLDPDARARIRARLSAAQGHDGDSS